MDKISILKKIINELKLLNNSKQIEWLDLEKLFNYYTEEKIKIEDEIVVTSDKQDELLKNELISIAGIVVSAVIACSPFENENKNNYLFLVGFTIYAISNFVKYIMEYKKSKNIYDRYDDIDGNLEEVVIDSHSIKKEMEKLEKEIDYLQNIIDTKDEEEAIKYLNLKSETSTLN